MATSLDPELTFNIWIEKVNINENKIRSKKTRENIQFYFSVLLQNFHYLNTLFSP